MNPCIDRTVAIPEFAYGGTNHITDTRQDVAGKGINVSIALKQLGVDSVCLGFNYAEDAALWERTLEERGIAHDFVTVPGNLRMNIKVFDESRRAMTEFNARGGRVPPGAVQSLLQKLDRYLGRAELLVMSGSAPEGVPDDIYGTMIRMARGKGVRTVLDASGALLAEGLREKPLLVKPNLDEFREMFREELAAGKSMERIAGELVAQGVGGVCISMGAEGAMLVCADGIFTAGAPDVEVRGVQGAGDSMVAGMCAALAGGAGFRAVARKAAGKVAVAGSGAGFETTAGKVDGKGITDDSSTNLEAASGNASVADSGAGSEAAARSMLESDSIAGGKEKAPGIFGAELLRCATAAAGGSLMQPGTQMCTRDDFQALYGKTAIKKIF